MKVEQSSPKQFTPVTITLETQDEVDQLCALFYYTNSTKLPIADTFNYCSLVKFKTNEGEQKYLHKLL